MLFVLTLVYLIFFHGFQSHAAPLTNLLAETGSNATVLSTSACICSATQRSVWDILWSCLATLFACSWVSVHPNIPSPNESYWRVFLRRLELMFWAVVGPELIITWALRQWKSAHHLEKLYKERGWTKTHGHFIQMGGFMLFEGNVAKGAMSPERFSELLAAEKIEFPNVTMEEIEDRSKTDGFSKSIALGQTLWFVAQCLARSVQHLDLTLVELLTLSLAVLNGVMYFLWWHKPLDVRCPIRVYLQDESNDSEPNEPNEPNEADRDMDHFVYSQLQSVFSEVSRKFSERRRQITIIWQSLPILSKVLILIRWTIMIPFLFALTFPILLILVFVVPGLFLFYRWISILGIDEFNTGDMKVPTFYSTKRDGSDVAYIFFMSVVGVVFGAIHCAGWFFNFPSSDEAILWRVSSTVLTGVAFLLPLFLSFLGLLLKIHNCSKHRRRYLIAVFTIILLVYVVSRLLLLVEAFNSLRHLTPRMLALVKWTSFIPHI